MNGVTIWPAAGQYFLKELNDRQFEIHIHMATGNLLVLFPPPGIVDLSSSDHDCMLVNTWNFVLNVIHVNNTQTGLSIFIKTKC